MMLDMELYDAMRTTGAIRRFTDDPLPDDVLVRIIEIFQTLPSYRMTAPRDQDAFLPRPSAGGLMRWLHRNGYLSYVCFAFTKA